MTIYAAAGAAWHRSGTDSTAVFGVFHFTSMDGWMSQAQCNDRAVESASKRGKTRVNVLRAQSGSLEYWARNYYLLWVP